jgi:hypothetical protein
MNTEQKIELTEIQIKILNLLRIGHKNAIGLKDLCMRTNENERKIRLAIEALRNESLNAKGDSGYLILISGKPPYGYFLAETKEEVEECMEYFRSRVRNEYHTYRSIIFAAKKKFSKSFGQLPLFIK